MFNGGKFDIIIASDEQNMFSQKEEEDKPKRKNQDVESGASRGIDFQFVSNIINFDFPLDCDTYIHRVGRTARGANQGTALSLITEKEEKYFTEVEAKLKTMMPSNEEIFKPFKFDFDQLDGIRYRAQDAWRRCTSLAVREVRRREIRSEILNSVKLRSYFEENPKDLAFLRTNKEAMGIQKMSHLTNLPSYNVPDALVGASIEKKTNVTSSKFGKKKTPAAMKKIKYSNNNFRMKNKRAKEKANDPLRSMKFSGLKKKK